MCPHKVAKKNMARTIPWIISSNALSAVGAHAAEPLWVGLVIENPMANRWLCPCPSHQQSAVDSPVCVSTVDCTNTAFAPARRLGMCVP